MSKELRAMLDKLAKMRTEVRSFLDQDKVDEAEALTEEIRTLQKKIQVQRAMDDDEEEEPLEGRSLGGNPEERTAEQVQQEYRDVFLRALRRQPLSREQRGVVEEFRAVMNQGHTNPAIPDGDSNMIVPQDIQTQINELLREFNDLSEYVTVEGVVTLSGSRVLEKDGDMIPFAEIEEYGEFEEHDNPKFTTIKYAVKKRGGILPLTNELLQDTDQNLLTHVKRWIAKKTVVTRNALIIGLLHTLNKVTLKNIDDVKRVLNVSLDPAIAASSIVLTNQDGYNWLDEQKDENGRYLLTDDITAPGKKLFKGKRVAVASNRWLPSTEIAGETHAPLVIGNLKQAIVLFSRKFYELASTKEGGNAWRRDTTELRTIIRDDIKSWDEAAAIFGQINITPPEAE